MLNYITQEILQQFDIENLYPLSDTKIYIDNINKLPIKKDIKSKFIYIVHDVMSETLIFFYIDDKTTFELSWFDAEYYLHKVLGLNNYDFILSHVQNFKCVRVYLKKGRTHHYPLELLEKDFPEEIFEGILI